MQDLEIKREGQAATTNMSTHLQLVSVCWPYVGRWDGALTFAPLMCLQIHPTFLAMSHQFLHGLVWVSTPHFLKLPHAIATMYFLGVSRVTTPSLLFFSLKSKLSNLLTSHLDLVVHMVLQDFYIGKTLSYQFATSIWKSQNVCYAREEWFHHHNIHFN